MICRWQSVLVSAALAFTFVQCIDASVPRMVDSAKEEVAAERQAEQKKKAHLERLAEIERRKKEQKEQMYQSLGFPAP